MKKLMIAMALITVMVSGAILSGCNPVLLSDKGPSVTKEYVFTDFTGIEVGHALELEVTASDTYKVSITASKEVLDRIDVSKDGSTLIIDMNAWFFNWHSTPKVTITMPSLQKLDLSGASHGNVRGFKSSHDFNLSVSGASELDIDMEAGKFTSETTGASTLSGYLKVSGSIIELSGASHVKLEGSGGNTVLTCSGASSATLISFSVNDADIDLSGASHASLDISGKMNVSLSGASTLEYSGNPTLGKLDISGASDIRQKEIK